jgi:hypothetical protein
MGVLEASLMAEDRVPCWSMDDANTLMLSSLMTTMMLLEKILENEVLLLFGFVVVEIMRREERKLGTILRGCDNKTHK